jgi:methanogenic corrinoid protein MtbC1
LIALLPEPPEDAPQAIGATVEGDTYTLPTTMIELSLRESGWRAGSYGVNLPVATMCAAIREAKPRLFWLSVSYLENSDRFLNDYPRLFETAGEHGTAVAVGGYALTEGVRKQIEYSTYCDTLAHLRSFAKTLAPQRPNAAHE